MKKKELLEILKNIPNDQDIPIKLVLDKDNDMYDMACEMSTEGEEVEILILPANRSSIDEREKIHHYLEDYPKIIITIDIESGILIMNEVKGVLREINFLRHKKMSYESRRISIIEKLLGIL